jgi:lipopolysaccharide export system permease protein
VIIDRAFYREVTQTSLVVTVIFVTLYVVISLVNLLGRAASGDLPVHLIFAVLGLQLVKNLSMVLPLAMFIGVLMTLSRWYRDNEMTVLAACGVGLSHFLRPAWILALFTAAMVGLLTFYLAPMAAIAFDKIMAQGQNVYQAGVNPGEFNRLRSSSGSAIVYVERVERDGTFSNVFASREEWGKSGVLVAKRGYEYTDHRTGDQFIVLKDGHRYEGSPGQSDFRILRYGTYALRLEPKPSVNPVVTMDEVPTRQLLGSNDRLFRAEWQWRVAQPVSLFVLAVFALVFAYTDARRGRFANLFTAILFYFLYANLLGIAHAMLRQGRLPLTPGLWTIHVLMAACAAYLLWRRAHNRPLLPAFRPRARHA